MIANNDEDDKGTIERKEERTDTILKEEKDKNSNNKLLDDNKVDVDILPKVGGNSIVINLCSCCVFTWSDTDKKK